MTLHFTVNVTDSNIAETMKNVMEVLEEAPSKNPDSIISKVLSAVAPAVLAKNHPLLGEREEENFFTRNEVCQLLKVSLTTLYNWQKTGELIPNKIGKRVLYPKSLIDEKLKTNFTDGKD